MFDEPENVEDFSSKIYTIDKKIKVPVENLDFRFGAVAFKYNDPHLKTELEFEVENDDIRPEFDVLKSYFAKMLKSKYVQVEIFAEFENNILVSQSASSSDIDRINREIIDSVKFRFLEKNILGKHNPPHLKKELLDINELQENLGNGLLFGSENDLLNEILEKKQVKHYRQLKYLASRHESSIMKLRFVLNPFSFVFLLSGQEQYHLVLETLDTEEATYIWHIEKNKQALPQHLKAVEDDLNIIRNKGRQFFMENQPNNFSRIIHDYSDERKGFVIWKDLLEERLT